MNTNQLSLPGGISMFQRGHILTLSGLWDEDLMDEFEHGLNEVRLVLPRTQAQKFVTLHLYNFGITANAVDLALSMARRTFSHHATEVAVVAEGSLSLGGLLLLAGSQRLHRKIFVDTRVTCSLTSSPRVRRMGFSAETDHSEPLLPRALLQLPAPWRASLAQGQELDTSAAELKALGLVDKCLSHS